MLDMYGSVKLSPESDGGNGTPDPGKQLPANEGQNPKTVPYERFKEVNDRLRALEEAATKVEAERKQQEEAKLVEQKKYQELSEKLKGELEAERFKRLRLEIASDVGIPAKYASRLVGTDEQSLRADAEILKADLKPSTPGVPPGPTRQEPTSFTAEQMRDPEFVLKNEKAILAAAKAANQ